MENQLLQNYQRQLKCLKRKQENGYLNNQSGRFTILHQSIFPDPRLLRPSLMQCIKQILCICPMIKLGGKHINTALCVVDVASRYKECEPLTDKTAANTAKAIEKIYSKNVLTYPNRIQVDGGNEFKGEFAELMKAYETKIKIVPPGNHNSQGIVERFNKTLAMHLFTVQYQKELRELYKSGDENREWVKGLPNIIRDLNNT